MSKKFPNPVLLFSIVFLASGLILLRQFFTSTTAAAAIASAEAQNSIQPDTLTGNYDSTDTTGEFYDQQVASTEIPPVTPLKQVLGSSNGGPKRIEVDLSAQRLYAFEGDQKVFNFLISSGKWAKTPTGTFHIWGKFRYTKMEGGSKAAHTYYYLPNVPYVMFFDNDQIVAAQGFSLHGTYWHHNFGHPMSHGCINMKTEEAAQIYNWAEPNLGDLKSIRATAENPGTKIVIYGVAPAE